MKIDTRFIKSHPLLALIPALTLRRLIARSALDEYPKGTVIHERGRPCDAVYLVISGRCEGRSRDGTVETLYGPGDALGARELLNNEPYRSTVTVLTHCVLLRISAAELERLFASKPSIAGRFSQSVFGRARRAERAKARRRGGRIVAFCPLSRREPERLERALAAAVQKLGRGNVLFARLSPAGADGFAIAGWPGIASRCDTLNGEFCLGAHVREADDGYSEIKITVRGEEGEEALVPALLSHLGLHYDFVLLRFEPGVPERAALEFLVQADVSYLFFRPDTAEMAGLRHLVRRMEERQCPHIRPILCVEPYAPVLDIEALLNAGGRPVHAFFRGTEGTPGFDLQLNRLAREIAQCRVGIALSSGGARGLAHIGVIQVLEENGIEVDVVAGSSMGAYVGALWAHGYTGEALERLAREVESRFGLLHLIDPALPPREGFMRSHRVARRLRRSLGEAHFSDLPRPLRVVATQLETMERVVFSSGEVVKAVEASIAIPGICVPVEVDGELYIDGGIADPLPVDVLAEMGVERIIAVNTIPTPEQLRLCVDQEAAPANAAPRRSAVGRFLNRHLNYFARGNILDTLFRSTHGVQMRVAEAACRDADVVLWTVSPDAKWHDFTNPGKYIALGRKVAQAHLPELKRLINKENEHDPAALPLAAAL